MDINQESALGELVLSFLDGRSVAIVDPAPTTRTAIASSFAHMGLTARQLVIATQYDDAISSIKASSNKVGILVTDYMIGSHSGLELSTEIFADEADLRKIAVFVLTNSSHQSGVVEAAEGLADAYILKPFSDQMLKGYMKDALKKKKNPSPLAGLVHIMRSTLRAKDYQGVLNAMAEYEKSDATQSASQSTLPLLFKAQAHEGLKSFEESEKLYLKILEIQPKNFNAIAGLYRLYCDRNDKVKAYEMISRFGSLFPMSPPKLCEALALAVETRNFQDVEKYYKLFIEIDERRDNLVRTMAAALVVGAIYRFQNKQPDEGVNLFQRAITTSKRNAVFIEKATMYSLAYEQFKAAERFSEMFEARDNDTIACLAAKYLVAEIKTRADKARYEMTFNSGIGLIKKSDCPAAVYRVLLKQAESLGKENMTETIRSQALSRWSEAVFTKATYEMDG